MPTKMNWKRRANSAQRKGAVVDALSFIQTDKYLTEGQRQTRLRLRQLMETEVAPVVNNLYENAIFDQKAIMPIVKKMGPAGCQIKGYGCAGWSYLETFVAVIEMSRVDASFATFYLVHCGLAMQSINVAGTEQQRQYWLPRMARWEKVGAFGLTEPNYGSDATSLKTTAKRVSGGWILNGEKRWIGNATFADVVIIWARDDESKQITGFLVERGTKGFITSKMQNKMTLRIVQNADIKLVDCFVADSHHLSGAPDFQRGTAKVLESSRAIVAAAAAGVLAGAYDNAMKYTNERQQFGKPLIAFQLVQEKLMRVLGLVQACMLTALHLARLLDEGSCSMNAIALSKAWCTRYAREGVSLCREVVGGNGNILDFGVMKPFLDMEGLYTYEGSYDINVLIAARGITGISALL
eukprot:GHVS01020068.1.p1 GENE.GHVS01020068.1~~GHVS01020068.1.p1  ORF type:complete len:410 (-),score=19.39 GHVS01020068.1:127-1356(-)